MVNSLQPVALKVTAKFKALTLAEEGYRQNGEIACPYCGEKYILLFDHGTGGPSTALYHQTLNYFREQIMESHQSGHKHDRLTQAS